MGFRSLRVINEDRVAPGTGFGTHPHRDMEIITYVLEGAAGAQGQHGHRLDHPAGRGAAHERRHRRARTASATASTQEPVHLLQIWILPERQGLQPSYEQKAFPEKERQGRLRLVASPDGREGSVTVHQDVTLHSTLLGKGEKAEYTLKPGRHAWVQLARGSGTLNGVALKAGDGAAVSDEGSLVLTANEPLEALLFDLA